MLLHGGSHTRENWHEAGYVERLHRDFTIMAMDIRGDDESNRAERIYVYA